MQIEINIKVTPSKNSSANKKKVALLKKGIIEDVKLGIAALICFQLDEIEVEVEVIK